MVDKMIPARQVMAESILPEQQTQLAHWNYRKKK